MPNVAESTLFRDGFGRRIPPLPIGFWADNTACILFQYSCCLKFYSFSGKGAGSMGDNVTFSNVEIHLMSLKVRRSPSIPTKMKAIQNIDNRPIANP